MKGKLGILCLTTVVHNALRLAIFLTISFIGARSIFAQIAPGIPPFSSQSSSTFDTINNASMNIMFSIPIVRKSGRGLPFNATLAYSGSVWVPVTSGSTTTWTPIPTSKWGWTFSPTGAGSVSYQSQVKSCIGSGGKEVWNNYYGFIYTDGLGTQHPFNINVSDWSLTGDDCGSGANPTVGTGVAIDGSGYTLSVQARLLTPPVTLTSLTDPSGDSIGADITGLYGTIGGSGSFTDTNGNQLTVGSGGQYFDTLSTATPTLTVSGSGIPSSPTKYTYVGPNTGPAPYYQLNYTTKTVKTNFGCGGVVDYGPTSVNLITSINLPDGTSYSFTYEPTPGTPADVTGRLASVTLPTGGVYTYSYGTGAGNITCSDGNPATVYRQTPDSGSGNWTYYHLEAGASWTTTVNDPQGNQNWYQSQGTYVTSLSTYQGTSTLLKSVATCYNGAPTCSSTITFPITRVTSTTTLGSIQTKVDTYYNSYGLPTEVDEYAFGSGAPGGLVRKTLTGYGVYNRVNSVTVCKTGGGDSACNGSGTVAARTTYVLDTHGNVQSETLSTGGTPATITRSFTYNPKGVLQTATDFLNDQARKLSITSYACGNNDAFPATITNGGLTTTLDWYCEGGVLKSVADANTTSNPTSLKYTDPNNFWRLVEVDYSDGGKTTTTYNDSPSSPSVVTSKLVSTGVNHQTTQHLDSSGRVTQLEDNTAGTHLDTVYDSLGRVASVSNPYYNIADPSYGTTSYSYDVLGRPSDIGTTKAITHVQDTNTISITYSSNCTTIKDEAGKARTTCTDAFGNITSVTEDPSPGLNYQTTYSYDAMNNLLSVTQGSQLPCTSGGAR